MEDQDVSIVYGRVGKANRWNTCSNLTTEDAHCLRINMSAYRRHCDYTLHPH